MIPRADHPHILPMTFAALLLMQLHAQAENPKDAGMNALMVIVPYKHQEHVGLR